MPATLAVLDFFAFYKVEGQSAGLALWQLFGSTNQLLAGLALLVVSLYLLERRRPSLPYVLPMVFMMATTLVAMVLKLRTFFAFGNTTLLIIGSIITAMALWLVVEAWLAIRRYRRTPPVDELEISITSPIPGPEVR